MDPPRTAGAGDLDSPYDSNARPPGRLCRGRPAASARRARRSADHRYFLCYFL